MTNRECTRWVSRSACLLIECKIAESCKYWQFDDETNEALREAASKHMNMGRPRLLDADGSLQRCEQCENQDGMSVVIGAHSISVTRVWAHNAFGQGVCRQVYLCEVCRQSILRHLAGQAEPWFDVATYGPDPECAACRAEYPHLPA